MIDENWKFTLYLAGLTPVAKRARANIEAICHAHLNGHYSLELVDLFEHPAQAESDQIFAVPTLVRCYPGPVRKMIGDLSNHAKVMSGMEIHEAVSG